ADAPLTLTAAGLTVAAGAAFSGRVASFNDANPFASAANFSASVAWADNQTTTGTVTANAVGGFDVATSRTFGAAGSLAFTVTIQDAGGSARADGTAQIVGVLATEGLPYNGPVAGFAGSPGASASDYSAVIAWGDGQSSAGSVSGNSSAGFTVSGTHTYA